MPPSRVPEIQAKSGLPSVTVAAGSLYFQKDYYSWGTLSPAIDPRSLIALKGTGGFAAGRNVGSASAFQRILSSTGGQATARSSSRCLGQNTSISNGRQARASAHYLSRSNSS